MTAKKAILRPASPESGRAEVEAYLAQVPEPARTTLEKMRAMIRSAAPKEATEAISYKIPSFQLKGGLVWYAAFKNHCSFFPMDHSLEEEFVEELKKYKTSKGTIQFPVDKPLPKALVTRIVKARVTLNEAKARDKNVAEFRSEREAKEYLAERIVEEAKRDGTPLTEVERKMLYFTESGWTLPDILAVNEEFERENDQDEYERKVGELAGKIQARDAAKSEQDQARWDDAVVKLSEGDHYLLGLIGVDHLPIAGGSARWKALEPWLPSWDRRARSDPKDGMRLMVVALLFTAFLLLCLFLMMLFRL